MKFLAWKTWESQGISKFQMRINPGVIASEFIQFLVKF